MLFEACKEILYSDTLLPDIFVTEYMPSMDSDHVKVYIYFLFLSKHNKQASTEELSTMLGIDINKVKDALVFLENLGLISRNGERIVLADLKEKEINKIYRMKRTSTPEEALLSSERNRKRSSIISAINDMFFQGVMSPSWYTDIDAWFDRYKFEEDVMLLLFQHCRIHSGTLNKNYIQKVADNWYNKGIRNHFDVDKFEEEYKRFKDIKGKIIKKLKLSRNLTEYEDELVEKWTMDYKYGFDVIDLALRKTTAKTNPNFKYIHAVLANWYEKGLRNSEEVIAFEKSQPQAAARNKAKAPAIPQHENYKQREYDDEYYDNLYANR